MQGGWPLYFLCHRAGCVVVLVITATRTPNGVSSEEHFCLEVGNTVVSASSLFCLLRWKIARGVELRPSHRINGSTWIMFFINSLYILYSLFFIVLYVSLCCLILYCLSPWQTTPPSTRIHNHSQSLTCLWSKFLGDKRVPNTSSRLSREI